MPRVLLFIFFLYSLSLGFLGCQFIEEGNPLQEYGIALGQEKRYVLEKIGKPATEFNFRSHGHRISILEYGRYQIDYCPQYEGDDVGILPPNPGFHERYHRDYRLVFIDEELYVIEDMTHGIYQALDKKQNGEISMILEKLRKDQ